MHQAITVKWLSATDTKQTRVKAVAFAGSVTLNYDYQLSDGLNAEMAMQVLIKKLGWDEYQATWQAGVLPSGDYVFVRLPEAAKND